MGTTSKMKLTTINGNDTIDPEVFNNNFKALDKLGKDYIVDQGTVTKGGKDWWYRKWNSGRAECGVTDWLVGSATVSKQTYTDPFYVSDPIKFGEYPITFKSQPTFYPSINEFGDQSKPNNDYRTVYTLAVQTGGSTTTAPGFYYAKIRAGNIIDLHAGCLVIGKWK